MFRHINSQFLLNFTGGVFCLIDDCSLPEVTFSFTKMSILISFNTLTVKLRRIRSACFVLNQQDDQYIRPNRLLGSLIQQSSWFRSWSTLSHLVSVCRPFCGTSGRGNLIFWQFFYYFQISESLYVSTCRKVRDSFCT